ncbi:hypothetical protein WME94_19945 [Sorangium sp. So ce429]
MYIPLAGDLTSFHLARHPPEDATHVEVEAAELSVTRSYAPRASPPVTRRSRAAFLAALDEQKPSDFIDLATIQRSGLVNGITDTVLC